FRIDNPAGSGGSAGAAQPVFTSVWWGLFGCNFTNWTDVTNTINVNQTTFSGHFANTNTPTFFVVDGQFSNEITTTGFRLGTNRDNYNFISGVSFNPRFRDDVTLVETTNDVFVDFGTRTIHAAQATRNFDTIPVETTSAGVRQVNGAGDNGFVIENTDANGRNTDQTTGTPRLSAPAFTGNAMRYWVYDLINYSTVDGSTNTVTPTARNWTNSMQFADFQNIDLPAETLLNGRSIADARTLNIDGAADARDFYPMTKALYNDDRDTNFPAFASTATNFNLGTVDLQIDTASNTDRPNAGDLRIHVGNTLDLAGLTITTDTFSLISGNVTMSNGTISMAAANFNGITFGNGIVIDQGVATNVPVANFAISNVPTLTFRGTPGANGISLTAVTITGGQFIPQQNLEVTQQQAMDFFGLTILPGNTGTSNGQTITVPAAPPVTVTLKPIGTIDDIRNAGGFWRVVNAAGTVVQTANITNTTTLDQVSFTQTSVQTDVFTWYYLPASVPGVSSFDFGTGTWMGTSMNFDANGINDSALTAGIDSTAVTYTTSNVDVSVSGSGTSQQLVITVNASATVSREQTQEIALVARNDVDYINTVVARGLGPFMRGATELSGRIIEFAQPFITAFNGDVPGALDPVSGDPNFEVIILRLNDAVTSPTGITNAVGYISQANGANPPVQFFDTTVVALSASIGQIQTAVDGSSRIQDIDNKTSYMVTDGATTNASTVGSNLFGIAPKDEDYDPNNNYITNT
ncbi:MAG: hypothetical protein MPJ25_10500, partial [Pirellulales bacterium]|nr:hypothetical protein [Pirellulales bacterium]